MMSVYFKKSNVCVPEILPCDLSCSIVIVIMVQRKYIFSTFRANHLATETCCLIRRQQFTYDCIYWFMTIKKFQNILSIKTLDIKWKMFARCIVYVVLNTKFKTWRSKLPADSHADFLSPPKPSRDLRASISMKFLNLWNNITYQCHSLSSCILRVWQCKPQYPEILPFL